MGNKRFCFVMLVLLLAGVFLKGSFSLAGYQDNGNGTVTDNSTGLVWQQDSARDDEGRYNDMTWQEALTYCEGLDLGGYTDWRLPSLKELLSLVDYSRYFPAINSDYFRYTVPGVVPYYWSSTTYHFYPEGAYLVEFDYGCLLQGMKTDKHVVRAVRGGQSWAYGDLDHFVISAIATPKEAGVPFDVTITAADSAGRQVLDFNGRVWFGTTIVRVYPTYVDLVDGQATASVRIDYDGKYKLKCNGYGAYGFSNIFDVGDGGTCSGKIFGRVVDVNDIPLSQITVKLYNSVDPTPVYQDQTDSGGNYSFSGLCNDTYRVEAEEDGFKFVIYENGVSGAMALQLDDIKLQVNGATSGYPVILVPGMMGSTLSNFAFPSLSFQEPCKNLKIYDRNSDYGWDELEEKLIDEGFKVVRCPWDWRMECDAAYGEYLIEKIDDALILAGVNTDKVYIVAHSMGGLMVRAYIQGLEYNYRNDVAKVAFVGTPHLGSCNPYYIWEGGDPKTVDDITDSGRESIINVYTNTLRNLWQHYNTNAYELSLFRKPTRDFVQEHVPSLRQLMYTEPFLYHKDDKNIFNPWDVESQGNENVWLKYLNEGKGDFKAPDEVMSTDLNKIQAKVFVGIKDDSTIRYVKTNGWEEHDRYKDGVPTNPVRMSAKKGTGDGTVPYESAAWPYEEGWAQRCVKIGEHSKLVVVFKNDIVDFLQGTTTTNSRENKTTVEATTTDGNATLIFSVFGDMRLMVSNAGGQSTGIDPSTQTPLRDIPSSTSSFSGESGGISIENPEQGVYFLNYFGEKDQDFRLSVSYTDDTTTEIHDFQGFRPAFPQTLTVSVNPASNPRVTITPLAKAPYLEIERRMGFVYFYADLSWSATDENINSYNVYEKSENEPYFTKVATVGADTLYYQTNNPWSSYHNSYPLMTYAVTAVKSDGTESLFSNQVQDDDYDQDGKSYKDEWADGTDPDNPDTDGDGLKDGEEDNHGTNPLLKDTDGDKYSDGTEVKRKSDPLDPTSVPVSPMSWLMPLLLSN